MTSRDSKAADLLEGAALRLRQAYHTGPVEPLASFPESGGHTLDEALGYRIQEINTRYWLDEGRRMVGRKIGLTSPAVQEQLGVDQPDYGILFADMSCPDGAEIPRDLLLQPRAEAEAAFVLERDLVDANPGMEDVVRAIAYVSPAIEVADSRVRDWRITLADTIADNASAGIYVMGQERHRVEDVDLESCTMTLTNNGEVVSTGTGAACLGNPLNAVLWLARKMIDHERPLKAGDVVLSGALGPMKPVNAGEVLRAEIHGLGTVTVKFT